MTPPPQQQQRPLPAAAAEELAELQSSLAACGASAVEALPLKVRASKVSDDHHQQWA
jgi:hypothetical protein